MTDPRAVGRLYVSVQAALFLAVGVTAWFPGPMLWRSVIVGLLLIVVGLAGVLWCARSLGRSLTPLPEPNGAGLVVVGLYRWVRHPMYSSLVVMCLGVAVLTGVYWCYLTVAVLAVFFSAKARHEERYLVATYPDYVAYGARVGRFVPLIGRLRRAR